MPVSSTTPDVLYIAGYGRSGSTVLDAWLGEIPGFLGTGELHFLPQYLADDRDCACGEPLRSCGVWPFDGAPVSSERAAEVTKRIESSPLTGGARLGARNNADLVDYTKWWKWAIQQIRAGSSDAVLVDSSKTMAAARHRVDVLRDHCELDVAVIHLVRDPRAVFVSASKGDNSAFSRSFTGLEASMRSIVGWQVANRAALGEATHRPSRYQLVRYGDFAADPAATMRPVLEALGFVGLALPGKGPIRAGHGVGGNKMRGKSQSGIEVRPDEAWRKRIDQPAVRMAHTLSSSTLRRLDEVFS